MQEERDFLDVLKGIAELIATKREALLVLKNLQLWGLFGYFL